MTPSRYQLVIIEKATGEVVSSWEPGTRIETDLVEELITRAKGYGIGWFKSEASVVDTLRKAFAELLYDLKSQVRP